MKNFFRSDAPRRNALGVAVLEKLVEHMPVSFQPVGPGIGLKD